jgi:hypothetical protein
MTNTFHNLSTEAIADEYGALKGQADALKERMDALKDELKARNIDRVEAPRFTVTLSEQVSKRLDTTALKAALGADICAEYERETVSTVLRVKPTVVFGQTLAA